MYETFFRLFFARIDPEFAHELAFRVIRFLPTAGVGRIVARLCAPAPGSEVETLGRTFPSPFGLAAGFDKNARAVRGLTQLGFGHIEVGTVTALAQPGNPRPRLFRLIPDRAVVNRMGFNNEGAAAVAVRLAKVRLRNPGLLIGVNIGKSRAVEVDDAIADYRTSGRLLAPYADYLVVNVSSPNTPGLRSIQDLDRLEPLLRAVQQTAGSTPLLVKIAPDLADEEIRDIGRLVNDLRLAGIIATNTTIERTGLTTDPAVVESAGAGGLSGRPLATRSIAVLRTLREVVRPETCVISVGGVETAEDVRERLSAGATLVQGYTGFLFRGPLWARQINRGLRRSSPAR